MVCVGSNVGASSSVAGGRAFLLSAPIGFFASNWTFSFFVLGVVATGGSSLGRLPSFDLFSGTSFLAAMLMAWSYASASANSFE